LGIVKNARLVYSTERGRVCATCGWPADNCKCSSANPRGAAVPDRPIAKLRLEKAGRGGKTVTVIYDLPRNSEFLKGLCADLKRACGTGARWATTRWSSRAIIAIACGSCCRNGRLS
jgi:translation initiation factor 1